MDRSRKRLPPSISYRTFLNFIDRLRQGIPARIDRSYWGDKLSGSTGTHLMAALSFLDLIDDNGVPTNRLKQLVSAKGVQRKELLKQMTFEAFFFLSQSSFDVQTATHAQLEEVFNDKYELSGDIAHKCINFYIWLANDAGIPLSPFVISKSKTDRAGARTKKIIKGTVRTKNNLPIRQITEEISKRINWDKIIMRKFPTFDPNWPDEVKLKWFEAFDKLVERDFLKGKK
jgi:hypothetical protein